MESERDHETPAERIEPEDVKPGDDMPSDRDLKPAEETDRVVEKKGEREPEGD